MKQTLLILIVLISLKTEAQSSVLSVADSLYMMGNYTKAIETYSQHPVKEDTFEGIARSYLALGNYDEALVYYDRAYNNDEENMLLKYDYAKLLAKMKRYEKAARFFSELIDVDYKNPNFHYELGAVLEKTADSLGKAQNRFHSAYELDNTHQKAIYKIARFHLVKRHHELVDKYVDQGLKSYANNKELISLKAQNFYWQEMYDDAAVWFQKLIDLGESSQFLHEKLSFCYMRIYDNKNAKIHCEKALKYEPKNPTNLYILGQIYQQEQDYVNAEKYFKKALEILDSTLDAEYTKLAMVLNFQDKYEEAIKTLQKAINENPKNIQAQFFMLTTKSAYYQDLDEKIKLHEEFINKFPEGWYTKHVKQLLVKLKEEKFMQKE